MIWIAVISISVPTVAALILLTLKINKSMIGD